MNHASRLCGTYYLTARSRLDQGRDLCYTQCRGILGPCFPRFSPSVDMKKVDEVESIPEPDDRMSTYDARVGLIMCAALYGSNFVTTKVLQEHLAPSVVTTSRFLIGTLFFVKDIRKFKGDPKVVYCSIELGLWSALAFIVQAITLQVTSANKNAFFSALSVVVIPLMESLAGFDCVFDMHKRCIGASTLDTTHSSNLNLAAHITPTKIQSPSSKHKSQSPGSKPSKSMSPVLIERDHSFNAGHSAGPELAILSPSVITPAFLAFGGVAAMECNGLEEPSLFDLVVLIAPLSFALAIWRSEQLAFMYPDDTPAITGILLLTTTVVSLIWMIAAGDFPDTYEKVGAVCWHLSSWKIVFGLIYNGVLSTAWTNLTEQRALKVLSGAETTVIFALEPVFAGALSFMFLHESFGFVQLIGAGCIVSACVWNAVIVAAINRIYVRLASLPRAIMGGPRTDV